MFKFNDFQRSEWGWLAALCALAAALRLIGLGAPLWYDELLTLTRTVSGPTRDLLFTFESFNNHVFFSLQAQGAMAVLGDSNWAFRLPAALFGIACVPASWLLARLALGRWPAFFAAALVAVSYHHVWFSQNARGYTGMLFWTLLASAVFVQHFHTKRWGPWLVYALCVGLGGFTHLSAGFLILAHAVVYAGATAWALLRKGKHGAAPVRWMPFVGLALGGLLTLVLHAGIIADVVAKRTSAPASVEVTSPSAQTAAAAEGSPQTAKASPGGASAAPPSASASPGDAADEAERGSNPATWTNPLWTVLEVLRSFGAFGSLIGLAVPVVLVLLVVGGLRLLRLSPLLVAVYAIHMPLMLLILVGVGFGIWPRYFFVDISFILICLVCGVFVVSEYVSRFAWFDRLRLTAQRMSIGVSTLGVLVSCALLPKNYRYPKQDFEGPIAMIQAERAAGDQVVTVGLASTPYEEYYKPGWAKVETAEQLQQVLASSTRTWLVYSFSAHTRSSYPALMRVIDAKFEMEREFPGTLGDGDVYVLLSRQ